MTDSLWRKRQEPEAMKLALEALKDNQHLIADNERHAYVMEYNTIIEKLEEALAKQEQGEPVALETVYETIIHWDEGGGKRSRRELARRIEALYTKPQQRKPLTNKQLFEHWQVAKVSDMTHAEIDIADYVLIVRDVEALHNIKE